MKLIRFPGAPTPLPGSTTLDPHLRLAVSPVAFTCTACGDPTTISFSNMIFRSVEFYCQTCGTPHRVSNPAFSGQASKK